MIVEWGPLLPHIIHDVRALARKSTLSSQLLERQLAGAVDPQAAEWLDSIVSAQRDLNLYMTRLGTLVQADRPQLGKREFLDLEAALLGAKIHCRDVLEESHADFSIGPLPDARVPVRLEVVWRELIANSCRFRDPNRPLKIHVDAAQNQDSLWIQFADNGTGWNPAFQSALFEPFQRFDPERSGFGLGLAITRAAVESVEGQIRAELGSPGACFQVQIPVAKD